MASGSTAAHPTAPPPTGLTGRKVALIFALFFGTIFTADGLLLVSALRTYTGAETSSAYKAGQLYNQEIALARAQAGRGWRLESTVERDGADARITVEARDGEGEGLPGRLVRAVLQRPTDKRSDTPPLELRDWRSPGRYEAVMERVAPGQWDLVVDVLEGGERVFRRKVRVLLP
jgi:nitrogen fixation protein FixH